MRGIIADRCDTTRVTRACLIACAMDPAHHMRRALQPRQPTTPPRQWLLLWVWLAIDMAMAVHSYDYGNGYGYDNGYGYVYGYSSP